MAPPSPVRAMVGGTGAYELLRGIHKLRVVVSFPGSPAPEREYTTRAWYHFSREHGVVKKVYSDLKGNVLHSAHATICSILGGLDTV